MVAFSPDIKVLFHFPGFAPVFYQQACELHTATNIFQMCNDAGSNEEPRVALKTPFKLSLYVVIFNDSR